MISAPDAVRSSARMTRGPCQMVRAFRIWPVAKCVDQIVKLLVRRRPEALIPWFTGPLLLTDAILGQRIGDRILRWKFPPEK